jgi:hypothetical protein
VHLLDIEQRVLYRALIDQLSPRISYPDRSDDAYESFKRAPLSVGSATHIVRADVASFYQYVDHSLLESEIVIQTGEAQIAGSIHSLLASVMGRSFGLPQNNGASHALADVYIDAVERQLIRLGQSVWRYNDDFAMPTGGLRQARRALEDLERSLRAVGLTPNDEKSLIHAREAYQIWVERPAQLRAQIGDDLSIDLDAWILQPASGYEDDDAEGEAGTEVQGLDIEHQAQVVGAVRALRQWLEHIHSDERAEPLERYVYRALARDAIRVLRRRLSSEGLRYCDDLLANEPQMTHTVCRYLSRIARVDQDAATFVAELVERPDTHLSTWQRLWLLEPVLWANAVPAELWDWVLPMLDEHTAPLLRARTALVLATHGRIGPAKIGSLFDESTAAARPDLVVAMVRASGGATESTGAVANEDDILRMVSAHESGSG